MSFNYAGLWKLLIDNNMKKTDLIAEIGISPTTLSNLSKNKNVSMDTLDKLCCYFNCDIEDIIEHNLDSYKPNIQLGTFRPNKEEAIHRWFSYMEGYSKSFVETELDLLEQPESILDPFGGSGTTMLVASTRNISSYYSEVNPAMSFIAESKINGVLNIIKKGKINKLENIGKQIIHKVKNQDFQYKKMDFQGFEKYYDSLNLQKIFLYKDLVNEVDDKDISDMLMVALASVAVETSKMIRRGDLRFAKGKEINKTNSEFISSITKKLSQIVNDIDLYKYENLVPVVKLADDARNIKDINLVDAVITSPPYLNGTNYFRNTKLELKLLDFLTYESDLAEMHSRGIIAGINGVARNNTTDVILDEVKKYYEALLPVAYDKRIPKMVSNYFYGMNVFFKSMYNVIKPKGKMIIDIGDSQFAGVHVPTHDILEKIARNNGFYKYDETVLRKRKSKNGFELTQRVLRFSSIKEV